MKRSNPTQEPEHDISRESLVTALSSKHCVNSEQLFAGSRELMIEHAGELYTLRHTRNGKLILTK